MKNRISSSRPMSGNDRSRSNWSSENSLVATHPPHDPYLPGPLERVLARALTKIVITLDLDDAITPESTIARTPSTAHNLSIRRTAYLPYVAAQTPHS